MGSADLAVVLLFAVVFPAISAFSYPKIKMVLSLNRPGVRVKAYVEAMFWLWGLAGIAVAAWFYQQRSTAELGLSLVMDIRFGVALILVLFVSFYLWSQCIQIFSSQQLQASLRTKIEYIKELLPRTRTEFLVFVAVAFTAAVCEEILYRGYLLWFLRQWGNDYVAVLAASILFGLAHSYQGLMGSLQTMVIGFLLCLLYLFSGSLWLCMLMHFVIDVYSGFVAWLVLADRNSV